MDFDFSAEQDALRDAVRSLLADTMGPEQTRALVAAREAGVTVPDQLWASFVELGWTSLIVPAAHGGLGLDLIDLVVVLEEMGRVPLPGPYLASAGFATRAAVLLGADGLLERLASGAVIGCVALDEAGSAGDPLAGVATTATRSGDGWLLNGVKPAVVDGHVAGAAIVVARDDYGIAGFLVEEPTAALVPSMDPTRALARLELADQQAVRLGPDGDQTALWRRYCDDAGVMLCAEVIGGCDRAFELAGEYAKVRVQFGRPIGTFQAIKHIAADMLADVTLARVQVHYAAWTSDTEAEDREVAAAMAKAWTAEAAIAVTGSSIQIHGGVGFTWDALVHLYYKRAKVNDLLLGRQGWQRQRVADLLLGPVPIST